MKFQKGQSGNPSGRPKVVKEIRDRARQHSKLAIRTLVSICQQADKDAARVSAAAELLNRGYGKPSQSVDVSGDVTLKIDLGDET